MKVIATTVYGMSSGIYLVMSQHTTLVYSGHGMTINLVYSDCMYLIVSLTKMSSVPYRIGLKGSHI